MDCRTARLLLDFQRPRAGELPADEAAELERHLAGCPECDAAWRAERRLDDHLGRAVRDVPVPDGLRERLLGRLKEERAAVLRRQVAWAARGAAVAAALLLGVFAWWHFVGSRPPHLDYIDRRDDDVVKYNARSAEDVQNWFRDHRQVTMVAPKQFNYDYLAEYDLATLQGKVVPKLNFQRLDDTTGRTRARVYVLTPEQFDLGLLRTELDRTLTEPNRAPEIESHDRRLTLRDSDEAPGTTYLIIYEGDDLQPLYSPTVGR
jgi:hypothetical protein